MPPAGGRSPTETALRVTVASKHHAAASGARLEVLGAFCFALRAGETAAFVGPSGCGKTTLLRIVAGIDRDFSGTVERPAGRLGMVFQEPRLLPWRSVEANVRLAAPEAGDDALDALFEALGLSAHRTMFPGELSLGLARRVAIARAFATDPALLLLDEPFVSLDDALARRLRGELARLVKQRGVTTLLVTHDIDEAVELADRIFLLSPRPARILDVVVVADGTGDLREGIQRKLAVPA